MSEGQVKEKVVAALEGALATAHQKGVLKTGIFPKPPVELPKREEWGDFASTAAMSLSPLERRPPREIAEILAQTLEQSSTLFERIEVAPPGFLNLTLKPELWLDVIGEIDRQGQAYGEQNLGQGRRVLVEYVSANPTGPLHVGHGRGAAIGNAVSRFLRAIGYRVTGEYYINDAGRQTRLLGASLFARYQELLGHPVEFPEDGYHGGYVREIAEGLRQRFGHSLLKLNKEEAEQECTTVGCAMILQGIKQDLQALGIEFDSWQSERDLVGAGLIQQAFDDLHAKGLLFEQDGALWFRSSQFGDEKDRVVQKQDGDYTYLASDIAYHRDKLRRGHDLLVNIWGADHHGYIPRMEATVQAFGYQGDQLRVILVQMVTLLRGGQKVEMSKRAGDFITMREVVEEVGADAAKFYFLMRRADTHLDFDLELAKQQSAENPVYYVQYAHARLCSLFRVADERGFVIPSLRETNLHLLLEPEGLRILKQLAQYPTVLQGSATSLEPHRMTTYLQELAGYLHAYYYRHRILPPRKGKEAGVDGETEFAPEGFAGDFQGSQESLTPDLTAARLFLMRQIQHVLQNGLTLLGVSAPDHM